MFRSLLAESESKLFPDNDLLRRLRLVTQDAEKCASVAQQLLNGKRQTRWDLNATLLHLMLYRLAVFTFPCVFSLVRKSDYGLNGVHFLICRTLPQVSLWKWEIMQPADG